MDPKKSLGENLKQARKRVGKTQEEVAKAVGIERSTYAHYEIGTSSPDVNLLMEIAKVLNSSVSGLLGEDTRVSPPVANAPQSFAPPDKWETIAFMLAEALKQREDNERLRIEQVDAKNAEANRDRAAAERARAEADRIAYSELSRVLSQAQAPRSVRRGDEGAATEAEGGTLVG